jgi:hypothetical protein
MTPVPLIVSAPGEEKETLKDAEPAVNTMLFTSTEVEMPTSLCED